MGMSGSKWLSSLALGVAASTASVATAQAATSYAMGECLVATAGENRAGVQVVPPNEAGTYMMEYLSKSDPFFKKYAADGYSFRGSVIKTVIAPKHGELVLDSTNNPSISTAKEGWYVYVADKDFTGEDAFAMQVEKYGLKIQINYIIEVPMSDEGTYGLCDPEHWKISQIDIKTDDGTSLVSTKFTSEDPFQSASLSAQERGQVHLFSFRSLPFLVVNEPDPFCFVLRMVDWTPSRVLLKTGGTSVPMYIFEGNQFHTANA